jgi:hypothetical protein
MVKRFTAIWVPTGAIIAFPATTSNQKRAEKDDGGH